MELGASQTSRPAYGAKRTPIVLTSGERISTAHMRGRVRQNFWQECELGDRAKGLQTHSGYMTESKASKSLRSMSPNDTMVRRGS